MKLASWITFVCDINMCVCVMSVPCYTTLCIYVWSSSVSYVLRFWVCVHWQNIKNWFFVHQIFQLYCIIYNFSILFISCTVVLQLFTLLFKALVVYVDIFCLSLLNAVWLHFLASLYIWLQMLWQNGEYMSCYMK